MTRTPKAAGRKPRKSPYGIGAINVYPSFGPLVHILAGGYLRGCDCRKLAAWLLSAADWLDQQTAKRGKKTRGS